MWGMTGGIEYHARNAVMNDSHAYKKKGKKMGVTASHCVNIPNAVPSCGGVVTSICGSSTPCHYPGLFQSSLQRIPPCSL